MDGDMGSEDYHRMRALLHDAQIEINHVSARLGELLDSWYGEYLGADEAESVRAHIDAGGRLVLSGQSREPPDVGLYRRLRFLLGRIDEELL